MKLRVVKMTVPTDNCFVCGKDNPAGLHAVVYGLENQQLAARVTFQPHHQSYPGRVHGGVITALLDEMAGQVVQLVAPGTWGVTGEINVRFRKPVPYGEEVWVYARVTKHTTRLFTGEARLYLANGGLADVAVGHYVTLPIEEIADASLVDTNNWTTDLPADAPHELDVPNW